jgi:hypothetical protein
MFKDPFFQRQSASVYEPLTLWLEVQRCIICPSDAAYHDCFIEYKILELKWIIAMEGWFLPKN